jgi:hypothetical protein
MLYFLNIFKIFGLIYFANYYLKKNYPQEYNKFLIETSLRIIYTGSVIQIKFKKLTTYIYNRFPRIKNFLDSCNKIDNEQDNIEYILNGKVMYLTSKEKIMNHIININKEDFIIYSDYASANSENICINKKIIITPNQTFSDKDFIYEISDIKFMLCEVYVGDKVYKITLKSDIENYNYYLVDNIIDKKFIIYYLIEFYNEDFSKSTDKFILKIIDHNVNICEIDITETFNYIQIQKDGYIKN